MNKKFLINIINNYKRNKKRLEEIWNDYYSIKAISYNHGKSSSQKTDQVSSKIILFDENLEARKLQKEIDAIDRTILQLDDMEKIIYENFFHKKNSYKWISNNCGISKSKLYRVLQEILEKLEKELFN